MNSFIEDEYIDLTFLQDCKKIEIIPNGVTKYEIKELDSAAKEAAAKAGEDESERKKAQLIQRLRVASSPQSSAAHTWKVGAPPANRMSDEPTGYHAEASS